MGLQIGEVTPVPTTAFIVPPTTVPTATPFLVSAKRRLDNNSEVAEVCCTCSRLGSGC